MQTDDFATKEKILNTTVKLLNENMNADRITVRLIANEAGVNSALINYYFHSKDALLAEAAGICMDRIAGDFFGPGLASPAGDPKEALKQMIKDIADFTMKYHSISKIGVVAELRSGSVSTTRFILPVLRQIYGAQKSEAELRLIALQLLIPLQVFALDPEHYSPVLSVDVNDDSQRNTLIDRIIDNILK